MADDTELLRAYIRDGSQEAFAELVHRKLPLVLSAALRRSNGDRSTAEDIAQIVFALLARKAASLQNHPFLSGWIFTTTHHVASRTIRKRQRRELWESQMALNTSAEAPAPWADIGPVIDDILIGLTEGDRRAILMRFFENQSFAEIARLFNINEDAARMRVNRALNALRARLERRGISSSGAAIGLALTTNASAAVPATLAATILRGVVTTQLSPALLLAMTISSSKIIIAAMIAIGAITFGIIEQVRLNTARDDAAALSAQLRGLRAEVGALRAQSAARAKANASQAAPAPVNPVKTAAPVRDPADPIFNPDARKLYMAKQAAQITLNVKSYFKKLGLSETQWDKYLKLLIEGLEIQMDAQALGQGDKLSTRDQENAIREQMIQLRRDLVDTIGPDANQKLIDYNWKLQAQVSTQQLSGQLAFTEDPLTAEQAQGIIKVLSQPGLSFGRTPDGSYLLSNDTLEKVRGILSPAQFDVLTQQQAIHRADIRLAALKAAPKP